MGGAGSGPHYHWWRSSTKTVVGDCLSIDANRWMREGILKAGVWHSGSWCWFRDAARQERTSFITYEVNILDATPWVRLSYTFTKSGEEVDYKIPLTTTRPRFGGLRWWFVCPLTVNGRTCNRRVGKVYLPPSARYFGCRQCHDLTYTSCQESRQGHGALRRLAADMGWDFDTVKRVMKSRGRGKRR